MRYHRERRGLTQQRLAEALEISVRCLQEVEAGKKSPSLPKLVRMAEELGVLETDLLTRRSAIVRKEGRPRARSRS